MQECLEKSEAHSLVVGSEQAPDYGSQQHGGALRERMAGSGDRDCTHL